MNHGAFLSFRLVSVISIVLLGLGCGPTAKPDATEPDGSDIERMTYSTQVSQVVYSACSTSVLRGLSEQLIAEVECLRPGTMSRIDDITNVSLESAVLPYLQEPAAADLERAAAEGSTIYLTSALRSLAQQYVLYRWYQEGRCGIGLAARPGRSKHESGLAIDVSNYSSRREALQRYDYHWYGSGDAVHFTYVGGGTVDLSGLSVMAFQRLWNRNHPEDPIDEDGVYGNLTADRLARSPVNGFSIGSTCEPFQAAPDVRPLSVYWNRLPDGSYQFFAEGPTEVVEVQYLVNGYLIGSGLRSESFNFPIDYTFSNIGVERRLEARGFDSEGIEIGLGVGQLDMTLGQGIYIRQVADATYEIGLERADPDVAAIEVLVDGTWLIRDDLSGLQHASRLAVLSRFANLEERNFSISTFSAEGALISTTHRTFTLR